MRLEQAVSVLVRVANKTGSIHSHIHYNSCLVTGSVLSERQGLSNDPRAQEQLAFKYVADVQSSIVLHIEFTTAGTTRCHYEIQFEFVS